MQLKNENELVVYSSKARKLSLFLLPFFGMLAFDVFSYLYDWPVLAQLPGAQYIKLFLIVALMLFLIRLAFQFCKLFKRYITSAPALVLNQEGLWLESYGLILWENVEQVEKVVINPLQIAGEDIVGLGICLKHPEELFNRRWLNRKILSGLKKNNAKHHLLLQHLDLDPQEVAQFAKQFSKHSMRD